MVQTAPDYELLYYFSNHVYPLTRSSCDDVMWCHKITIMWCYKIRSKDCPTGHQTCWYKEYLTLRLLATCRSSAGNSSLVLYTFISCAYINIYSRLVVYLYYVLTHFSIHQLICSNSITNNWHHMLRQKQGDEY